ncbi:MAG: DUF4367 domain-containing protein [Syntrophomonadaceae bacterium]|nr:DUF4367 domain-containing protein [Syntrophomonadaceae bacterium]
MHDDKFDSFLSNSLKASELEVKTPINELEQMIIEKITVNKQKKKQKQRRMIQIAAAVILLIGIAGAAFFPEPVYALKKQFFQTILNIGKSINISLNSDADQLQLHNKIAGEVAAIQEDTPFKILVPQYIPPGFNLESVKQSATDEKASIVMSFTAPNANILFTQTSITDKFSSSVNVDAQQAKTKKVQIDKYEGNLITFEDGSANLLWITDDHLMCQIFGDISSDQATEMANSIK